MTWGIHKYQNRVGVQVTKVYIKIQNYKDMPKGYSTGYKGMWFSGVYIY